jgi:hypothetical protein
MLNLQACSTGICRVGVGDKAGGEWGLGMGTGFGLIGPGATTCRAGHFET